MKMLQHQRLRCPTSCKSVQKCHSTLGTHSRLRGLVAAIKSRMEAFKLSLCYILFTLKLETGGCVSVPHMQTDVTVLVFFSQICFALLSPGLHMKISFPLWPNRFAKQVFMVWLGFFFFITLQACSPHHVQQQWNLPICWVRLGNRATIGGFNF